MREWGAIPLKYMHLYFEHAAAFEAQAGVEPRGRILERLQKQAMALYATGQESQVARAVGRRPTPWYEHAVAPFIAAYSGSLQGHPFFLTSVEDDGLVRERPFKVGHRSILPLHGVTAPPRVEALTKTFIGYEDKAARAIWNWDCAAMKRALESHPWSDGLNIDAFIAEVLAGKGTSSEWIQAEEQVA